MNAELYKNLNFFFKKKVFFFRNYMFTHLCCVKHYFFSFYKNHYNSRILIKEENQIDLYLPFDFYHQKLNQIGNIKITPREIDVIACLISGKTNSKEIASLLSIPSEEIRHKTVDFHISKIMLKFECRSRENIAPFIERTELFFLFKQYYLFLCLHAHFGKKIQEINKRTTSLSCLIFYDKEIESLIKPLKEILLILKVETILQPIDKMKFFRNTYFNQNPQIFDHCFIIYSKDFVMEINFKDICDVLKNPEAVTLLSLSKNCFNESGNDILNVCLDTFDNYHVSLLKIFQRLFSHLSFETWICEFQQYQHQLMDGHPSLTYISDIIKQKSLSLPSSIRDSKKSYKIFLKTLMSLGVVCLSLFFFKKERIEILSIDQRKEPSMIRPYLSLPSERVLVTRDDMLKQMTNALNDCHQGVQTVALVGIGGSGKTTLAHHYAQTYSALVVWEINAETPTTLSHSFEGLAYALAQTDEEKKTLKEIQEIRDIKDKQQQVVHFIKQKLQSQKNWLLIYDNVEKFSDLQAYFPTSTWGYGKVILTTRDHNIRNNTHVAYTIPVGELTDQQKLNLFQNIMNHQDTQPLTLEQNQNFLEKIPPFPLDISTAAFYLKMTNVSQRDYLNYLEKFDDHFDQVQENILKEMGEYHQTRYHIIKLSLDKIIQEHPDFKDLLLFISLLDSQNIPKDLLATCKSDVLIDKFIFALKKYSLITIKSDQNLNSVLSIHRSLQRLILLYIKDNTNSNMLDDKLQSIVHIFENYIIKVLENENIVSMMALVAHVQILLNDQSLLTQDMKKIIRGELGGIYCSLGFYLEAQDLLESVVKGSETMISQNHAQMARVLYYLGSVYGEIGKNSKAIDTLTQCLALYLKLFPHNYQKIAQVQAHLGNIYRRTDPHKSKELLSQSLKLYKTHLSQDYNNMAWVLLFLAYVTESQGEYQEAKNWAEQSLQICEQHLSDKPLKKAWALASLGEIYTQLGEYTKARINLKESLKICEQNLSKHHKGLAVVHISLGILERLCQNFQESAKSLDYATLAFKKIYAEASIARASLQGEKGILERDRGYYDQALGLFQQSLNFYGVSYQENYIRIANLWRELGYTYLLKNNLIKAEFYLQKSLKELKAHPHTQLYLTYECLAELFLQKSQQAKESNYFQQAQEDRHQAIHYLDQALAMIDTSFPKKSPHKDRLEAKRRILLI